LKISRLLEYHKKFASQGLPENFGDGYLVANNRFYGRVRRVALRYKYRFSSEKNDAYETFPLLQLESILRSKVLPFSNNMAAFNLMTPAQLEALDWEDVEGNLKKNFVFHEGGHAFARELAGKTMGARELSGTGIESQLIFALRMLIEESCANTCELLGTIDVHDQVHRIFFEMNSYMVNFENRTHLKNAMAEVGEKAVVKFLVLAYLQSNLLRKSFAEREFDEMVKISGEDLDAKKIKTLRALGKVAFQLSERFRIQTTGFHLRIAGIHTPLEKLFAFEALDQFKKLRGPEFLDAFAAEFVEKER